MSARNLLFYSIGWILRDVLKTKQNDRALMLFSTRQGKVVGQFYYQVHIIIKYSHNTTLATLSLATYSGLDTSELNTWTSWPTVAGLAEKIQGASLRATRACHYTVDQPTPWFNSSNSGCDNRPNKLHEWIFLVATTIGVRGGGAKRVVRYTGFSNLAQTGPYTSPFPTSFDIRV